MNPAQVAKNRTARLAAQGVPVAYSTETPEREHLMVVEMEYVHGGRTWSSPMTDSKVAEYIDSFPEESYMLSDIDHASKCWCGSN